MTSNTKPISVNYSDEKLRILVEEYITQQKNEISFKGLCSYILYWAMEEGKTVKDGNALYESSELQISDQKRLRCILDKIVANGRITKAADDNYTSSINN